jgi:acyl carrier protein
MTAKQKILMSKIADILEVNAGDVTMTSVATDFPKWDSMTNVELVFMLEREYDVTVPLMQTNALQSIAEVVRLLDEANKL